MIQTVDRDAPDNIFSRGPVPVPPPSIGSPKPTTTPGGTAGSSLRGSNTTPSGKQKASTIIKPIVDTSPATITQETQELQTRQNTLVSLLPSNSNLAKIGQIINDAIPTLTQEGLAVITPVISDYQDKAVEVLQGSSQGVSFTQNEFNEFVSLMKGYSISQLIEMLLALTRHTTQQQNTAQSLLLKNALSDLDIVLGYSYVLSDLVELSNLIGSYAPLNWKSLAVDLEQQGAWEFASLLSLSSKNAYIRFAALTTDTIAAHSTIVSSYKTQIETFNHLQQLSLYSNIVSRISSSSGIGNNAYSIIEEIASLYIKQFINKTLMNISSKIAKRTPSPPSSIQVPTTVFFNG